MKFLCHSRDRLLAVASADKLDTTHAGLWPRLSVAGVDSLVKACRGNRRIMGQHGGARSCLAGVLAQSGRPGHAGVVLGTGQLASPEASAEHLAGQVARWPALSTKE